MCERYTLEWLDSLITVSLNPAKKDLSSLSDEAIRSLTAKVIEEKERLLTTLRRQLFSLTEEKQLALLVNQFHSSLITLLDELLKYYKAKNLNSTSLKELYDTLVGGIEELLSFIELRFFAYLSPNERVPATSLSQTSTELKQRVDKLKDKLLSQQANKELAGIILNTLYCFINRLKEHFPVTFQELLYQKELLKELELVELPELETSVFTTLDELLISLNFNSKPYVSYLKQRLIEKLNAYESMADKWERLLFYYKQFNQLYQKPGVMLNSKYSDLKTELSNWFAQEICYLEKTQQPGIAPIRASTQQKTPATVLQKNEPQKLLCILSVDQMALLLRAADDLRLITARSLNTVFKTIVPHLSTPYQENISYDSMRSKSYTAETRDKEIVIQTLERIIKKVKEY